VSNVIADESELVLEDMTTESNTSSPMIDGGSGAVGKNTEDSSSSASKSNPKADNNQSLPTLTPSPELRKAENIDLKDVIDEPGESLAQPVDHESKDEPVVPVVNQPITDADTVVDSSSKMDTQQENAADSNSPEATQGIAPLIMLDNEVPPGTSTRLSWMPEVSFMGIAAPTAVLVVHGVKPGPKVCLTAAIHGDELNGIEVVRHVLYSIDPQELSGTVIGVPIVNLQGFRRSSRYLPDRRDLNRYFPGNPDGSSAGRIAHSFFQQVITQCDLLVDLHTGSFHRTNLPQLRANLQNPKVAELARQMGSIVVVHSEGAPGCLRRAAVDAGIPAVTLEAGQPNQLQKSGVNHGIKSVENLLDSLSMVDRRPFWKLKSEPVYYQSRWVRVTSGGILFSDVELGELVKQGHVLGVLTDPITNARQEVLAPFDGRVIGMALNQVMYPGFAAYHLGLQSSVEAVEDEGEISAKERDTNDTNEDGAPDPVENIELQSDEMDERILEDS